MSYEGYLDNYRMTDPPCWICKRPNERARGYDDPNEAEACAACEQEYAASFHTTGQVTESHS